MEATMSEKHANLPVDPRREHEMRNVPVGLGDVEPRPRSTTPTPKLRQSKPPKDPRGDADRQAQSTKPPSKPKPSQPKREARDDVDQDGKFAKKASNSKPKRPKSPKPLSPKALEAQKRAAAQKRLQNALLNVAGPASESSPAVARTQGPRMGNDIFFSRCPVCGARVGEQCKTPDGRARATHERRKAVLPKKKGKGGSVRAVSGGGFETNRRRH
jgi:hypothetical protein